MPERKPRKLSKTSFLITATCLEPPNGCAKKGPDEDDIWRVCAEVAELLSVKNRQYGGSITKPLNIFSKATPLEQVNGRIDDKLSRIARGTGEDEDVILDLLGYLILRRIVMQRTITERTKGTNDGT